MVLDVPANARDLSCKLAQAVAADQPPAALVDKLASTVLASKGDLKAVMQTLMASDEFWSRDAYGVNFKTPDQYLLCGTASSLPFHAGIRVRDRKQREFLLVDSPSLEPGSKGGPGESLLLECLCVFLFRPRFCWLLPSCSVVRRCRMERPVLSGWKQFPRRVHRLKALSAVWSMTAVR